MNALLGFPIAGTREPPPLRLRSFGHSVVDLQVDYENENPGELATAVLNAYTVWPEGGGNDPEQLNNFSLGDRIAALTALAGTVSDDALTASIACASCGEQLEVMLPAADLIEWHLRSAKPPRARCADREIDLRLPTARDLERWSGHAEHGSIARELALDTETLPDPFPPDWVEAVEQALAAADPLTDFHVVATCPECAHERRYEVDLQQLALKRLQAAQRGLLRTVHRLASTYHWTEREIMALPASRRVAYLAMIEGRR
jgi:hypothetical protein